MRRRDRTRVSTTVYSPMSACRMCSPSCRACRVPRYRTEPDGHGGEHDVLALVSRSIKPGSMSKSEYDNTIHDLVAFLDYVAEPYKQTRKNVGTGVIIFLLVFLVLAYKLKKEYWKDVH